MSLPFLILAGTVAYTVIEGGGGGSGGEDGSSSTKTTSASSASASASASSSSKQSSLAMTTPSSKSVSIFLSGIAVGVGLSLLATYELKRRRLWQRVRLQLLSWLYDDLSSISAAWTDGGLGNDESDNITSSSDNIDDTRLVDKLRKPTKLETITGTPIPGPNSSDRDDYQHGCGSHVDLVSIDWTLTNGMSVDMFTLAPGIELLPNKAKGVEFYFVVKGDGDLTTRSSSDDHDGSNSIHHKKERITQGMGFIIDPDTIRGFQARKGKNLVLLRATDVSDLSAAVDGSGGDGGGSSGENVGMKNSNSNKLSNAKNMIVAGLGKIQSMVEAYGSDPLSSNAVPTSSNAYNDTFDQ